jgi:hypothetical protein
MGLKYSTLLRGLRENKEKVVEVEGSRKEDKNDRKGKM